MVGVKYENSLTKKSVSESTACVVACVGLHMHLFQGASEHSTQFAKVAFELVKRGVNHWAAAETVLHLSCY